VSTATTDHESTGSRQLVAFSLGQEQYAVPIMDVQEIIRYTPPRSVPHAASYVEGVINLRGRIIPVIDVRTRFGMEGERAPEAKIVVITVDEHTVGIVVDAVDEVLTVTDEQVEPPPAGLGAEQADYIEAVAKLEDGLLILLHSERLLGEATGDEATPGDAGADGA